MAQNTYRANLTAAEFPLLSDLQGQNVIVPGIDQNYSRQANSTKNRDRDIGIPQAYYMHNVVPTDAGLSTVSMQVIVSPVVGGDSSFGDIYTLRDVNENTAYFAPTSTGRNYVLTNLSTGWVRSTDLAPAAGRFVSTAHVNGQTYICFGGLGVYKYNFTTGNLDAQACAGVVATAIMGICASNGYMIIWTDTSLLWSSLIDPTDFVPSLITGAGGGGVQMAKAAIVCCLPQNGGFIVYTKKNAVAQSYTNNSQFPFNAVEIGGAGGLSDPNMVAFDGNSTAHFAYTTSGLQQITMNAASIIFPQVTDYISGAQFEDYDELSNTFTEVDLSMGMKKKVVMVSNRYVVISYGMVALTHSLVYDLALARWGKLKQAHVDCFEYLYPSSTIVDVPKRSIGMLQADGTIILAVMSYSVTGSNGVVILGKYQMDRNRYLKMHELNLESIKSGNTLTVKLLSAIDGANTLTTTTPVLLINNNNYRKYGCNATGKNHTFILTGAFHLHSAELKFSDAGGVR